VSTEEFESLLQQTKNRLAQYLNSSRSASDITPTSFEQLVFDTIVDCATGSPFEGKLRKTNDRDFPDIVDDEYFGVEVKATKKDDWTSIGNSVLESSRVLNIEKIYVLFGKLGGTPEVDFKNYEDCLKGIAVTHYPRYQIDMRLNPGETIFDKLGITYDELRKDSNPVRPIRSYYEGQLKPGQSLWWVNDNLDDSAAPSPIIKDYSTLETEEKKKIIAEVMALFPEVFRYPRANYKKVAAHLAAQHGVVSTSLRDEFSGGGRAIIKHRSGEDSFPHVFGVMLEVKDLIIEALRENDKDVQVWLHEIDRASSSENNAAKASQIFNSGSLVTYKQNG